MLIHLPLPSSRQFLLTVNADRAINLRHTLIGDVSIFFFNFKDQTEARRAEKIPYWWRVTTQIWVVLLIGWIKFPMQHEQSEALPRSGWWRVISMEFLRSFLRRLAGKTVVTSPNVGCFLRLDPRVQMYEYNDEHSRVFWTVSDFAVLSTQRLLAGNSSILRCHVTPTLPIKSCTVEELRKTSHVYLSGRLRESFWSSIWLRNKTVIYKVVA